MKKRMLIWVCKREWATPFQPSPFQDVAVCSILAVRLHGWQLLCGGLDLKVLHFTYIMHASLK